jgi:hypothetical protein
MALDDARPLTKMFRHSMMKPHGLLCRSGPSSHLHLWSRSTVRAYAQALTEKLSTSVNCLIFNQWAQKERRKALDQRSSLQLSLWHETLRWSGNCPIFNQRVHRQSKIMVRSMVNIDAQHLTKNLSASMIRQMLRSLKIGLTHMIIDRWLWYVRDEIWIIHVFMKGEEDRQSALNLNHWQKPWDAMQSIGLVKPPNWGKK